MWESRLIGELTDSFEFRYDSKWINDPSTFDLAFSLPRSGDFSPLQIKAFFANLITEGDLRSNLARGRQFDQNDIYSFLAEFGEDCAGALTIVKEGADVQSGPKRSVSLDELDRKIDQRQPLQTIEGAHFSLAGAQDKIPVIFQDEEIFLPNHVSPSTHILKPVSNWDSVKESVCNEWFCMNLARLVGLPVPNVSILHGKYNYYLIERYDRKEGKRIHQQDFCQALGIMPEKKYEIRGGPSFPEIYQTIQTFSQNKFHDLSMGLNWFLFNLLIGNNDTHAKNISFLYDGERWQLAPFYDIMSTTVYDGFTDAFAFTVGGQTRPWLLKKSNIHLLENDLGLKKETLLIQLDRLIVDMTLAIPEVEDVCHQIFDRTLITSKIIAHFQKMVRVFDQRLFS
jgi:serine/threonine-protein kinase HipA